MAAEGDESLSRLRFATPTLGVATAVTAAGVFAGLLLYVALRKVGAPGVIAPALAVGAVILLRFPALTMSILLIGAVLFEPADPGLLPTFNSFYVVVKASLTPIDLLLFLGLAGVLGRFVVEGRRPHLPEPLTGPLILLGLATLAGVITGYTAQFAVSKGDLFHRAMNDVYIILIPLLVVNVVRDRRALRLFVAVAAALASIKGLSGAYAALTGGGSQLTEETISYLEPVPNLVMLTLVLGTTAALVRRQRLPLWCNAGAALSFLALLLSYRRSFWIALAFTLILVIIIASRRRGRAVLIIGAVALGLTFFTVAAVGSAGPTASPLVKRAAQLSPAGIEADRGDRYRTDERHNVIENIEEHPLTGIGLGVPWKVHTPLAESHDRRYVHFALLWFWLELGPLGALAYLALMAAGLWAARAIWKRHPDPIVQIGAIAAFGAIVGVMIVELTAAFTGIEARFSIVLAAGFGWLAAAWRDLPPPKSRLTTGPR
jgi:O-antigen ligase